MRIFEEMESGEQNYRVFFRAHKKNYVTGE